MTQEGDLILVYMEGKPAFFARIEAIEADVKPHWFQVKMLVLQVPLMVITWILRTPYINGEEFTMGGNPVRIEKVVSPENNQEAEELIELGPPKEEGSRKDLKESQEGQKGKVVSLMDRRKKE